MYNLIKGISSDREAGSNVSYSLIYNDNINPPLEMSMTQLISRRNKEDSDDPQPFELLNKYIEYKGDNFKMEYYSRVKDCLNYIDNVLMFGDFTKPTSHVHSILDLFLLEDIYLFLREVYRLNVPSQLLDTFDESIELDGKGSRVQTYIKDEYIQLAALSVMVKSVIGLVGEFAYVRNGDLNGIHKEYLLFQMLYSYKPLSESEPMKKIMGFIGKLIELTPKDEAIEHKTILDKQVSKDYIPLYIASTVILQKVGILGLSLDGPNRNIVTKIYNYIKNKLKNSGDVSKSIRNKDTPGTTDEEQNQESIAEIYRAVTDLAPGIVVEYNWALRSTDVILNQLKPNMRDIIDVTIVNDAKDFTRCFLGDVEISEVQIDILAMLFKTIVDPRSLERVSLESILNLMSVGFSYLWGLDSKIMALLLTAKVNDVYSGEMSINSSTNISRLTKEIKAELDILYPYHKIINETTTVNTAVKAIDLLAGEFLSKRWVASAYPSYVEEAHGEPNIGNLVVPDIKIQLANMLIKHERRL